MKNFKNIFQIAFNENLAPEMIQKEQWCEIEKDTSTIAETGFEYIENGEFDKAIKLLSFGLTIDNTDIDLLNGLAIALCEEGNFKKSKNIIEMALQIDPEDAITLGNLAAVHWEQDETDLAIHYYNKAIEYESDIEDLYINLINLYIETDAIYMAFITAQRFREIFPKNIEIDELIQDIILNMAIANY